MFKCITIVWVGLAWLVTDCTKHFAWHLQSTDTFIDKYKVALEDYNNLYFTEYGLSAFDAVYVAALGMNASVDQLRDVGLKLEGFQFGDFNSSAVYADILRETTGKMAFHGVAVST